MSDRGQTHTTLARIMALFEEAVALDVDARREYVERLKGDDPAAAAELDSLLAAYDPDSDFLAPLDMELVEAPLDQVLRSAEQTTDHVEVGLQVHFQRLQIAE